MKFLTAATLAITTAAVFAPSSADAQSACEVYRVKKGDSLAEIAESAYGDKKAFRQIWTANRSEIGRNPDIISVGTVLRLPCEDGSIPDAETYAAGDVSDSDVVSFVTANGYLPYTDESLFERGLVTHLVRNAMARATPDTAVEIVFVNDWSAHLEALLPRQAFDASFPWTRPGCETQGELTSVELYACQNYVYSDPLYEIVDGFFSRTGKGFENIIEFAGFEGTTICRPEGYPTSHLEENGLMPPAIELVTPTTTHECFEQLMTGAVDVVALDTRTGERVMEDLGLTFEVSENPHLFSIQPLQVALHKDNPRSVDLVKDLNRGLSLMLESGEWASIVSEGLREQPGALVN